MLTSRLPITEVHPLLPCILCHSKNVSVSDSIPYAQLRNAYQVVFKLDIDLCLKTPYATDLVHQYRCLNCGIDFFSAELAGTSRLYDELTKNNWYYGNEKWEFDFARPYLRQAASVLEIGCGSGHFLSIARKESPQIRSVGLEFTPASAAAAQAKGHEVYGLSIEDFASEDKNKGAFDLVCSFQVLEHVADPAGFLAAASVCLRPGGVLILSTPNRAGFTQFAVNDLLNLPPHHLTRWDFSSFHYVAKQLGLKTDVIQEEPVAAYHYGWYRSTMLAKRISKLFGVHLAQIESTQTNRVYRIISLAVRILDRLIPKKLWSYRLAGHTICAAMRKPN